ncbi:RNA polymerase sigma-70 factor [soil metagenome]
MFEVIFREHYNRLCRYASGILNDKDDAEEVVQQMFLSIWEKRQEIDIKVSVKSYLFRAVHNRCLNLIQQIKVRQNYAEGKQSEGIPIAHSPAQVLQGSELEKEIKRALDVLPEQCKKIFELSRFAELKYSEIASQLEISVKTVENQMGKALRILRAELKDYLPIIALLFSWMNLMN